MSENVQTRDFIEWDETLEKIATSSGTSVILGGTDVGKTTFCRLLVNRLVEKEKNVAIIDADVGQSEVGPPTCIGMAFVEKKIATLSELQVQALAFVGSVNPSNFLPEHIAGVVKLAAQIGDKTLVVDTSGYIQGYNAHRLMRIELDLLAPSHIIALQRKDELRPILQSVRHRRDCTIHTPSIPSIIGKKTAFFRANRREMRFASYFQTSTEYEFSFDEVALGGTWLGGADPLAAHLEKFISEVFGTRNRVYYAELAGRRLGLMLASPVEPHSADLGVVMEHFKTRELSVTIAPNLKNLILGLEDRKGRLLGLGILAGLDFKRRTLKILTPLRASGAVSKVCFGRQRIDPDGADAGLLRPEDC